MLLHSPASRDPFNILESNSRDVTLDVHSFYKSIILSGWHKYRPDVLNFVFYLYSVSTQNMDPTVHCRAFHWTLLAFMKIYLITGFFLDMPPLAPLSPSDACPELAFASWLLRKWSSQWITSKWHPGIVKLWIRSYLPSSRNVTGLWFPSSITHADIPSVNTRGDTHIFIKMHSFNLTMLCVPQMCGGSHISTPHLHTSHWCQPLFPMIYVFFYCSAWSHARP